MASIYLRVRHSEPGQKVDRLVNEAKKKADQEELEKVELGNEELGNVLHCKYLSVMR